MKGVHTKATITVPRYGIKERIATIIPKTRKMIIKMIYHPIYLPKPIALMSSITLLTIKASLMLPVSASLAAAIKSSNANMINMIADIIAVIASPPTNPLKSSWGTAWVNEVAFCITSGFSDMKVTILNILLNTPVAPAIIMEMINGMHVDYCNNNVLDTV